MLATQSSVQRTTQACLLTVHIISQTGSAQIYLCAVMIRLVELISYSSLCSSLACLQF